MSINVPTTMRMGKNSALVTLELPANGTRFNKFYHKIYFNLICVSALPLYVVTVKKFTWIIYRQHRSYWHFPTSSQYAKLYISTIDFASSLRVHWWHELMYGCMAIQTFRKWWKNYFHQLKTHIALIWNMLLSVVQLLKKCQSIRAKPTAKKHTHTHTEKWKRKKMMRRKKYLKLNREISRKQRQLQKQKVMQKPMCAFQSYKFWIRPFCAMHSLLAKWREKNSNLFGTKLWEFLLHQIRTICSIGLWQLIEH